MSSAGEPSSGAGDAGDTTLFIATAASYASDGPTLPIIGGVGEHSDRPKHQSMEESGSSRPAKKQRSDGDYSEDVVKPEGQGERAKVETSRLYEPWKMLDEGTVQQMRKRLGGKWEEEVEVVVWTKNQNVKSGINRLKSLLGFQENVEASEESDKAGSKSKAERLIAVSAHGEGTTKLVGIVEMTKRIVGGSEKNTKDTSGEMWFTYTNLSSTSGKDDKKKVPVLTIWLSRKSIPEFKILFGEQTFRVTQLTTAD